MVNILYFDNATFHAYLPLATRKLNGATLLTSCLKSKYFLCFGSRLYVAARLSRLLHPASTVIERNT